MVMDEFDDGWAYGMNLETDERGIFPLNSVDDGRRDFANRASSLFPSSEYAFDR
jgi:hypothetical protein